MDNKKVEEKLKELEKEITPNFFSESDVESEIPDSILGPLLRDRVDN
ncbi:hypothetical protein ACFTQ7_16790 [Lysinibacillus sp. NPDC056959]